MGEWMSGWTAEGPDLLVAGGVGAMALVALIWFFAHRRDPIPLWLGLFCFFLSIHFLVGDGHALDLPAAFLAGPFLVLYAVALYPGGWQRYMARGAVTIGAAAAIVALRLDADSEQALLAFMQLFAVAVAAMAGAATIHAMRERRTFVPLAIAGIALAGGTGDSRRRTRSSRSSPDSDERLGRGGFCSLQVQRHRSFGRLHRLRRCGAPARDPAAARAGIGGRSERDGVDHLLPRNDRDPAAAARGAGRAPRRATART